MTRASRFRGRGDNVSPPEDLWDAKSTLLIIAGASVLALAVICCPVSIFCWRRKTTAAHGLHTTANSNSPPQPHVFRPDPNALAVLFRNYPQAVPLIRNPLPDLPSGAGIATEPCPESEYHTYQSINDLDDPAGGPACMVGGLPPNYLEPVSMATEKVRASATDIPIWQTSSAAARLAAEDLYLHPVLSQKEASSSLTSVDQVTQAMEASAMLLDRENTKEGQHGDSLPSLPGQHKQDVISPTQEHEPGSLIHPGQQVQKGQNIGNQSMHGPVKIQHNTEYVSSPNVARRTVPLPSFPCSQPDYTNMED